MSAERRIALVCCGLLCAALLVWWAASYLYETTFVTSHDGQVILVTINFTAETIDARVRDYGKIGCVEQLKFRTDRYWHFLGFAYVSSKHMWRIYAVPFWFP